VAKAYLEIDVIAGKEKEVRDALMEINGVKSANLISGQHDVLAVVKGESYEAISESVLGEIGMVKGIKKTTTNFVFD